MGRRIAITGVSRGLGRALVHAFDAAGHTVYGCARSAAGLQSLAESVGRQHRLSRVDVADEAAVAAWTAEVFAHGPVSLLINNAALINRPAPLWEVPADEFAELIDVNVISTVRVLRHFIPRMIGHGAVIVNISSGWGRSVSPGIAPYCASKWAIEGLSRAVAAELPRGLACVALNPGIVDTDMLRTAWSDGAASFEGPDVWAQRAAPMILGLSSKDNGRSLSVL